MNAQTPDTAQLAAARLLDDQDELARFRDEFVINDLELIYLDGNSLGRLPNVTTGSIQEIVERQWGERLIRSWGEGWIDLPQRIGAKIAQLIGAHADEVIVADSTSVNLYKLATTALRAHQSRRKVVTDNLNFPSDLYILESAARSVDAHIDIKVADTEFGASDPVTTIEKAVDANTALVSLSHTTYKSGYTYDMPLITEMAHQKGSMILWDLSHSVGVMPIDLGACGAEMAVGCTYKYLNGGPGAPAFLYVRRDLQEELANPLSGWMGQHEPFTFALSYRPASGLKRFLTGTPPILSLAPVEWGVDLILKAGIEKIRDKSIRQTEFLISLWEARLQQLGFTLRSPRNPDRRGSHVTLAHDEGLRIDLALINEMKVIPDFRQPDNIRLGIAPLYNTYRELAEAVDRICTVVIERRYEKYANDLPPVT